MSVWYGLLFVVLEGLRVLNVNVEKVQPQIDAIYADLKLHRNATFHAQRKYWSPKFFQIMKPGSTKNIWAVHAGVGEFLLQEMTKRNQESEAPEDNKP